MTLYNVHIYREMRVYFPAVEADTPEEAAAIAADRLTEDAEYTEDCQGENLAALVDVVGDDQYEQSVTIDFEVERQRKAVPELLRASVAVLADYEAHIPSATTIPAMLRAAIAQATTVHINQPERTMP